MKFDLSDLNPGVEFAWEDEAKITLRTCNSEKLLEITKQTTKKKVDFRQGVRVTWEETDESKQRQLIWDYCICSWSGIVDKDGNQIECSTANKMKLMNGSVKFARFVTKCLDDLNAQLREEEAKASENF